jgi:hypothetical protein
MKSKLEESIKNLIIIFVLGGVGLFCFLCAILFLFDRDYDNYEKAILKDKKGKEIMKEVAIQQAKEYLENGKFITEFKFQGDCYIGKSILSPDRTQVVNYWMRKECSSAPNETTQYMEKLFILSNSLSPKSSIAVVKCSSPSYHSWEKYKSWEEQFDNNSFFNGSKDPSLVDGIPKCPNNSFGRKIEGSIYYPLRN